MTYNSARGDIRIVSVGDAMLTRSLTPFDEPAYLSLLELMRGADITIANLETVVRTPEEGIPNATTGTVMTTPPALLDDLKWMGIKLVSTANNHACDYGVSGITSTIEHLEDARLPYAGTGTTLTRARAPGFADTRMGRVGLVAATSFFAAHARAGDSRPDSPGRPGINPIRFSKSYTVDEQAIVELSRVKEALGMTLQQKRNAAHFYSSAEAPQDDIRNLNFLDGKFERGNTFSINTKVHPGDAEGNLRQIREAKRRADWVVFAFHNHELGEAGTQTARTKADLEEPSAFALDFARAAIDAGADIVACHGPHVLFGVEIYKGRPILHSLGNFIFQNDTVNDYPADAYARFDLAADATPADFIDARSNNGTRGFDAAAGFWHGLAAECEFRDNKLAALKLHPLDLGFGARRSERGRPMLAAGEVAREALERVQRLSRRYGTTVEIVGDTGIVAL